MAKPGGGIAARMAMLQLDPSKMMPGAMADFQAKMREKELARLEAESKAQEEEQAAETPKSGGQDGSSSKLVHAKKAKMVRRRPGGKGKRKAPKKTFKFENKEQERPNVLREIQGDEMLFVQNLKSIMERFQKPILGKGPDKFGITDHHWGILTSINKLCKFHERVRDGPLMQNKVAQSFTQHKEEMTEMHASYRESFQKVMRVLHALRFSKPFQIHVAALRAGHPPLLVPSSYVTPLERMSNYTPLLEKLLKCTNQQLEDGSANAEYQALQAVLEWVKREEENTKGFMEAAADSATLLECEQKEIDVFSFPKDFTLWRPGRRLIRSRKFAFRHGGRPIGNVVVHLCNDVVVWVGESGEYKGHAPLTRVKTDHEDDVKDREDPRAPDEDDDDLPEADGKGGRGVDMHVDALSAKVGGHYTLVGDCNRAEEVFRRSFVRAKKELEKNGELDLDDVQLEYDMSVKGMARGCCVIS